MKSRKLMSVIVASMIWTSCIPVTYGQVLHSQRVEQNVTKGVKLISEAILTEVGWRDVNVLKINLADGYVSLRPVEASTLGTRETVSQMVSQNGAVAGINADFFDMKATYAPSFGPVIEDGKIKHTYNYKYTDLGPKKHMATFVLDKNNNIFMDYYGVEIGILVNGQKMFDATTYNTMTGNLTRPIVIDTQYYKNNAEFVNKYKGQGVYTILVENDEITYLSKQDEIVDLKSGTQAIILNTKEAAAYYPLMTVGDELIIQKNIVLNEQVVKAVEEMKMGIGGGGLIMKEGQPYTGAAHKVSPDSKQPRTILATTNNAQELLLITIDGRGSSIGTAHKELPEILTKYGVKDAMYLDGGGSTTLVARNQGDEKITVQNNPSQGKERKVSNGIGIFSTAPKGTLNKLYIEGSSERSFVGEPITFSVKGVDEYDNPMNIEPSSIKTSVTGVSGTWKGLSFYPESSGKGLVIVEVNGVEVATEIIVTNEPIGLYVEPSSLQVNEHTQSKVKVYGVDKEGYKIPVTPEKIEWSSTSQSVKGNGETITSTGKEVATLTAKYKNAIGKVGVTVGEPVIAIESFETSGGKWAGDTATVKGKVEPSKEIKYQGNQSLKMSYIFDKDINKQVAYTVFDKPIEVPSEARSINMWVYAKGQPDGLKLEVQDANGKTHDLKVTDSLKYDGWKYQTLWIPEEVKLPAKISKIYTYTSGNDKKRENAIYIDHISATRGVKEREGIQTRDDYRYDPLYKQTLSPAKGEDYTIKAVGPTHGGDIQLSNEQIAGMSKQLSTDASMILFASKANVDMQLEKSTYTYNNQYQEVDYKDTKVMFVGTDAGSIRKTNATQWTQMKTALESTSAQNIIMVLSKNPLTQFDDVREGKVLQDYLKETKENTGKNIFVIYAGGTEKEVRIEDGIRYIRVSGLTSLSEKPTEGEYLKFKIHEGNIYYTFEPVM